MCTLCKKWLNFLAEDKGISTSQHVRRIVDDDHWHSKEHLNNVANMGPGTWGLPHRRHHEP